jgi:hypothetical protein
MEDQFWTGFACGWLVLYAVQWLVRKLIVTIVLRLAGKEIAKMKAEEGEIFLKIEKHNGVIYCYRKDNNEFVGQGATLEEIAEQFKKKYPSNDARILKEDADGLMP